MSIYIFSRPVHSGKTTELMQWCGGQKNIAGIVMPDMNGSRKIIDLQTKTVFDIEYTGADDPELPLTHVGRFHFYTAVFDKANEILLAALDQPPHWLVIDEAGKLELECKGFYRSIIKAVELYNNENFSGNLLITVRESLLAEVIDFFNIKNFQVITQLKDLLQDP
jgi:nucleoside-triphosphatase THEP1